MDRKKNAAVMCLSTEVLERILDTLTSPEDQPPSESHPLGGQVSIAGIGMVPVDRLRSELARRPQCPIHDRALRYVAEIGAPGYGKAYECPVDEQSFHVYGDVVEDPSVDGVRELSIEDVI